MSRWDALRSENEKCGPQKSFSRQRPPARQWERRKSQEHHLDWHRQLTGLTEALKGEKKEEVFMFLEKLNAIHVSKAVLPPKSTGDAVVVLCWSDSCVAEEKRLELAYHILADRKVSLTNRQVKQCVDSLAACQDSRRIGCLSRLVLVASRQMPAEETAKTLVANILLPAIEDPNNKNVLVVIDALHCLVMDPLHASALLSPLTLDISSTGQEETLTNPLSCRLLRALQSLLSNKLYSYRACACLVTVMKATHAARDATNEINVSILMPFFMDAARETNKSRQETAFELLRVVLKTCPTSSTSLSGLFIGNERRPVVAPCSSRCPHCRHETFSPLLDLVHDANDEILSRTVVCTQELLEAMPLHLWVGTSRLGLQHFGRRTLDALVRLMQIVQCRFQQRPSTVTALCPLVEVILSEIPYVDDENDEITCQAMRLLTCGALVLVNCRNRELVECFAKCMGGRSQPQGGLTAMSVPMRAWLSSILSQDFRNFLWNSLKEKRDSREDAMQILCAIVRSSPSFVFGDQISWERCQQVIVAHTGDVSFDIQLGGVMLLEHVLTGRMQKSSKTVGDDSIALFATSIAFDMLKDPKPQFRTTSLKCFGAFQSQDWLVVSSLSADEELPSFQDLANAILFHCTRPNENNAGVRSVACTCIGNICTKYLCNPIKGEHRIERDEEKRFFCASVCKTLLASLQDSNVVKGSAIFAIGNLAHALRGFEQSEPLLPLYLIQPLCEMMYTCLLEKKGKLVSNAIRTIGHLVSLAFNPPYIDSGAMNDWDSHSFYGRALRGLDAKVARALALEVYNGSSWKERASINKNGWGACNSLALVLDCDEATEPTNVKLAQDSLGLLVQCIAKAEFVHEKVASAATAAIRRQSVNTLSRVSGESGIVGVALSPCLLQLYQIKRVRRQSKTQRLANELELLLEHLLRATSISDVCYLIKQEDVEKKTLGFLYDWMVEANMPVGSFEAFALALQRRDLLDDASLQQKFASRALQLNRTTTGDDPDEL